MEKKRLFIKNMVCNRCVMVVEDALEELQIPVVNVQLGEVMLEKPLSTKKYNLVDEKLQALGFELISDKKSRIIEKIKAIIIEWVQHPTEDENQNLSTILSERLHHEYNYLSSIFSSVEGITIEKYFIAQKIEKVKELLVYDELSLNEIADRLHYSSAAYLSSQFKKVTGLSPSHFKTVRSAKRKPLDEV